MLNLSKEADVVQSKDCTFNLDGDVRYRDAQLKLITLRSDLSAHSQSLEKWLATATRLQQDARTFIQRELVCLPGTIPDLVDALLAGGHLTEIVTGARKPLQKTLYARLRLTDPEDLETIKKVDQERAAVTLLKHAITSLEEQLDRMRRAAVAEYIGKTQESRSVIARDIIAVLTKLKEVAERDRAIFQSFGTEERRFLRPRPFPDSVFSADASAWFLEAVEQGLIIGDECDRVQRMLNLPNVQLSPAKS